MSHVFYRRLLFSVALSAILGTVGVLPAPSAQAQSSNTIVIQNYSFNPQTLSVPVGTTVTWMNSAPIAHTTTSDTGLWDSGPLNPGAEFQHTFNTAGTFTYHCNIHPYMHGTIVVGSSTAPPPATLGVTVTPSVVALGTSAIVHGTGFSPNNWAFAYWQRPDNTTNGIWVPTDPSGMFTFTLGFAPQHGTGTEFVNAYDWGTQRWAGWAVVTVTAGPASYAGQLYASPNPVPNGGTTVLSGHGFTPLTWILVQWTRPNGSMNSAWQFADATGSFAFNFYIDPQFGCGPRTFVAFDSGTGKWSASYQVVVNC
jgi:plastocyanin